MDRSRILTVSSGLAWDPVSQRVVRNPVVPLVMPRLPCVDKNEPMSLPVRSDMFDSALRRFNNEGGEERPMFRGTFVHRPIGLFESLRR